VGYKAFCSPERHAISAGAETGFRGGGYVSRAVIAEAGVVSSKYFPLVTSAPSQFLAFSDRCWRRVSWNVTRFTLVGSLCDLSFKKWVGGDLFFGIVYSASRCPPKPLIPFFRRIPNTR